MGVRRETDNNRENLRNNVFKENASFNFQFESDTSVWNKQLRRFF